MNQVQKFGFGLLDLRVALIDGAPWFVAVDVYHALGLRQHGGVLNPLDQNEKTLRGRTSVGLPAGRDCWLISESGLYKLVMRSDKPDAKAFQDWVTRVVLPAIRKDGGYVLGEEKVATGELDEDELVMRAMAVMQRKVERLKAERDSLADDNARLLPSAQVGEAVGRRKSLGLVDFARKLPGVNTMQVQKTLQVMNYLHKRTGHWAAYSKFKGVLFDEAIDNEGRSKVVILEKGQQLLVQLYHDGYLPMRAGCTPAATLELSA